MIFPQFWLFFPSISRRYLQRRWGGDELAGRAGRSLFVFAEAEKPGDPEFPVPGHLYVPHLAYQHRFQPDNLPAYTRELRGCGYPRCKASHQFCEQLIGKARPDFTDRDQLTVVIQPQQEGPEGRAPATPARRLTLFGCAAIVPPSPPGVIGFIGGRKKASKKSQKLRKNRAKS